MFHSSESRSYNFECPSCRAEINLPNRFVQKCAWNKNNRLKEDLRNLTEKWSLIKREVGYVDCVKHIHAISDYLEDVIELFQNSALGKHIILEDAYTNTDEWPPANIQSNQMAPYDQQASYGMGHVKVESHQASTPQNPLPQQFQALQQLQQQQQQHHHQQAQVGPVMGGDASLAWNQQQWGNQQPVRQFPMNESYPNVGMNQAPQYGSFPYSNQNFQNNAFQNQGFFGNFQNNFPSNEMQNTSNFADNFNKRKAPRPPKELIQIKTAGYVAKIETATDEAKTKIQNKQSESALLANKQKNRRMKRRNNRKNISVINASKGNN